VSGDYLRTTFTIPEDAAPDEAELKHRSELVAILAGPQPAAPEPDGDEVDASTTKAAPPSDKKKPSTKGANKKAVKGEGEAKDVAEKAKKGGRKKSVTASGSPDLNEMSLRLAKMERSLRQRIQAAADSEMRHVLDKAGNRLRSYAQRDKTKMASNLVANVPSHLVAATLGKGMVTQFAVTNEDLLAGGFQTLEQRYKLMVKQSQKEMRREMREYELLLREEELEAKQEESRNNGWLWFAAALTALAAIRLYEPTAPQPIGGEFEDILVSAGIVRESLRIAGGGAASTSPADIGSEQVSDGISGLTSGQTAEEILNENGLKFSSGYVWIYGSEDTRKAPFEPHLLLDLYEFSAWDDDALVNNNEWPPTPFYFPGDHQYCQCDAARIIEGEISDESAVFVIPSVMEYPPILEDEISQESTDIYQEET
jgi:hypothetical protein